MDERWEVSRRMWEGAEKEFPTRKFVLTLGGGCLSFGVRKRSLDRPLKDAKMREVGEYFFEENATKDPISSKKERRAKEIPGF